MASARETADQLLAVLNTRYGVPITTVRLLEKANCEGNGAYARKILKAMETAGILKMEKPSHGKGFRWSLSIDEPSDAIVASALKSISNSNRAPKSNKPSGNVADLLARIEQLEAAAVSNGVLRVEFKIGTSICALKAGEILPTTFNRCRQLAECRRPIMLVGPAGCGKTHLAGLVAKSLDLRFAAISCSAGMSEAHLLGRSIPNVSDGTSRFQGTDFLECYESGGVFLLDEIDAADSNLLVMLNSGLANGYLSVPARTEDPSAIMHKDFVIIASANTFGRGADRLYVGRSQLDEATIDRFRMGTIQMDYDKAVETAICPDERVLDVCWQIRDKIQSNGLRRIMSTRFIKDAYAMVSSAGWSLEDIVETYFQGWNIDEANRCRPIIQTKPPVKTPDGTPIEYSKGKSTEGSSSEWKLPNLTDDQRNLLKESEIKISGISAKQSEYAERIVSQWMSTTTNLTALLHELGAMGRNASNPAARIIRWFGMKYVPGTGKSQPE